MKNTVKSEIVIVGAGAAGLFTALCLYPKQVTVLSEKPLGGISASTFAQGGIAAAVGQSDDPKNHAKDTLKAAAGIADPAVVDALTAAAPEYIKILERYGVRFERGADGHFTLSREACHSQRRVLKALEGDGFGKELMRALVEAVRLTPSITFVEGVSAERLIRGKKGIAGVIVRKASDDGLIFYQSPAVVLATGGIGGLFAATTNPLGATGKGVAMAAHAGAVLADLEFVQFHPTALDIGEDPAPLATEALRGEGARLVNDRGESFMEDIHEMGDLAPRDIVSRGLFAQIQAGRKTFLDCTKVPVEKFPALLAACARKGLDPKYDLVPVMPAVHYHMGGIATDLAGKTSITGLWAAGEVAATGLHGANRLASNSLMEAIIMGGRVARDIAATRLKKETIDLAEPCLPKSTGAKAAETVMTVRVAMTTLVGVIRDKAGLEKAIALLSDIEQEYAALDTKIADMALTGRLIAQSALARTESRGGHFRRDYPQESLQWQRRSFVETKPQKSKNEAELVA